MIQFHKLRPLETTHYSYICRMSDPQAFYDPREQMVFSEPVSKSPTNKDERTAKLGRNAVKLGEKSTQREDFL